MDESLNNAGLGERVLKSAARLVSLLGVADATLVGLILEEQAVLAAYAAPALPDDPDWIKSARLGICAVSASLTGPVALCTSLNCQPVGEAGSAATALIKATKEG